MEDILKYSGMVIAGAISLLAVLLLAKPIFDAFKPLSELSNFPTALLAGVFLLAIGAAVFERVLKGR